MRQWKAFFGGVMVTVAGIIGAYFFWGQGGQQSLPVPWANSARMTVPPGTVNIKVLPPLITLSGTDESFEGRKEIPQPLGGLGKELVVLSFRATGENANKSKIKIVWEDGGMEYVSPGTGEKRFAPERRVRQVSIMGYCFHERRVFHDLPRQGTLSWEIRYAPVEK